MYERPIIAGARLLMVYSIHISLAGQTLTRGGDSLVKFPSGFGVAYSAVLKRLASVKTPRSPSSMPKKATARPIRH